VADALDAEAEERLRSGAPHGLGPATGSPAIWSEGREPVGRAVGHAHAVGTRICAADGRARSRAPPPSPCRRK
jgi:hypothetical protein